jgi:hypothetical protein
MDKDFSLGSKNALHSDVDNDWTDIDLKTQIKIVESVLAIAKRAVEHNDTNVLYNLCDILVSLFSYTESSPIGFIDINEYILHLRDELEKGDDNHEWSSETLTAIHEQLQQARDLLQPTTSKEEKQTLESKSLPILKEMVQKPDKSPILFVKLAITLDDLIKSGQITPTTAASEILSTLDRPQIKDSVDLKGVIEVTKRFDYPGELRRSDATEQWHNFMLALKSTSLFRS